MRYYLKKLNTLFLSLLFTTTVMAGTTNTNLASATDVVSDIQQVIASINQKSSIPVLFPTVVPVMEDSSHLYASGRSVVDNPDYNKYWTITVDVSQSCQGEHVCNVGTLTAAKGMKLDKKYLTLPDQKSHKKEHVNLDGGYTGYYTPFHTEASGVNPTLEWKVKDVLYTLQWRIPGLDDKNILIAMVNSAIKEKSNSGK